ncbi:PIN domain-containing protein [Microbacterium sp. BWT-B31]|uniref:PIN domain-containing protein n=1 Tax=Microbacterium sp. BWT-B31 TaxID=3232072 RepID=UPI0035280CE6
MPTSADLLLDTSAAIALVTPTAETHDALTARTRGAVLGLAGHAAFETYSVLTRLPGALRLSATGARRVIDANFPRSVFLPPRDAARALATLSEAGIAGGAVYDGLVALAATSARLPLLSCDRRAQSTYAALSVPVELL